MFERGQVVRFHYLWARQANAGEESGRKARPVCFVVRTPGNPGAVYSFRSRRRFRKASAFHSRSGKRARTEIVDCNLGTLLPD